MSPADFWIGYEVTQCKESEKMEPERSDISRSTYPVRQAQMEIYAIFAPFGKDSIHLLSLTGTLPLCPFALPVRWYSAYPVNPHVL